jgi:predicted HD superfamily hydrolase involved in NAD metabolism
MDGDADCSSTYNGRLGKLMEQPVYESGDEYVSQLADYLPAERVQHSINVAEAARQLAERHYPDLAEKAWVAGLLHDNAKSMPLPELAAAARDLGIAVSTEEAASPGLLHGKVGAGLLAERFGVGDAEIGMAVADHVTGRRGMGPLSLILYVADQTAADRDFEGVAELRELARNDLFNAAALVCRYKLLYILGSGKLIVMETVALYNELHGRLRDADD